MLVTAIVIFSATFGGLKDLKAVNIIQLSIKESKVGGGGII